jgi:YegS/Rv2252/BmrU family lipid kinase
MKRSTERVCFIINPKAAAGLAGKNVSKLEETIKEVFHNFRIDQTQAPKHATKLTRQACQEGFDLIVSVGGDGTCHEVLNGLIENDQLINPNVTFAVVPIGTGSDLIKSLHTPKELLPALRYAAFGEQRFLDVGKAVVSTEKKISSTSKDQETQSKETKYFLNVAGFGANGEVVRRANSSSKRLGGRITFMQATVHTSVTYKSPQARVRVFDHSEESKPKLCWEEELLSCFIANGSYCGGGMWVAPQGSMHNGKLDVSLLSKKSVLGQIRDLRHLYNGTIDQVREATCVRGIKVIAEPLRNETIRIDLDGELSGVLPAAFDVLPNILSVRAKWHPQSSLP